MLAIVLVAVGLAALAWGVWMTVRVRQMAERLRQVGDDVREIAKSIRADEERVRQAKARAEQAVRVSRERRAAATAAK